MLDHAASCESCHAAITVAMSAAPAGTATPANRIDRYTLGRVIGRGAMGVVHVANDPELGRDVALKILRPLGSPERLRREAQALAKLTHPNVVRVYDIGEDAGQTFIAMELVNGENLREWLASPRTVDEIVAVLVAAGRGLAAAHAVGLVHRDFKPDNVLVSRRGDVLVGDFGLARIAAPPSEDGPAATSALSLSSDELTATGVVVGTPAYMAPEQVHGDAHAASDQYAFCVTAWEALFGRRPFDGATLAELRANARAKRIVRPAERDVPREIEAALRRGLEEDAGARWASMDALIAALDRTRRGSRRRWIAAGAVVVALGGGGAAWFVTRETVIDCDATAALIEPAWSPYIEGVLRGRVDSRIATTFGLYAKQWQQARVATCAATHVRHEQSSETLDRRVACLDRARDALRTTVSVLVSNLQDIQHPDSVVEALPPLERCNAARVPVAAENDRPAIASLETELTELEVHLAGGTPSLSLEETAALRERADKLGFPPTALRARISEARVAKWDGDSAAAEAILRDVIVRAERANDDSVRANANALLAVIVATSHTDEAAQLAAAGRAALARSGGDPQIEEALMTAEVEVLRARGDLRGAAELQEKVVAHIEARIHEPTRTKLGAYNRLAELWGLVPDYEKSRAANAHSLELSSIVEPIKDPEQLFRHTPLDFSLEGDFEGAVALGRRQIAYLRSQPDPPARLIGYILGQIAGAHEFDLDNQRCIDVHREAEQAWSLPLEAYRTKDEPPSAAEITYRRVDEAFGLAGCLRKQGNNAEALKELRRARELAVAGGKGTAELISDLDRNIGIVLVESGDTRGGKALLDPFVPALTDGSITPYSRALLRFALARAVWLESGTSERPRARALAEDAIRDIDDALGTKELTTGPMRKLPILLRELRVAVEKWLAAHRL